METVQTRPPQPVAVPELVCTNPFRQALIGVLLLLLLAIGGVALYYTVFQEDVGSTKPSAPSIIKVDSKGSKADNKGTDSSALPISKEPVDTGPGVKKVRYVRLQRVKPSPKDENIINIVELVISNNLRRIPIVTGVVNPLFDGTRSYD